MDRFPKSDFSALFDRIKDLDIYETEMNLELQKLTNDYNLEKLEMVLRDFTHYLDLLIEEQRSQFSDDALDNLIDDYKKNGIKIPMTTVYFSKKGSGDLIEKSIIDYDKLIFPENYLAGCYYFIKLINKEIAKHTAKSTPSGSTIPTPEYPHSTIFIPGAYKLFALWHEKFYDDQRKHCANYSFLIRKMIEDKLVLEVKMASYLEFLNAYGISIPRLKTIDDCSTKAKKELYLELKKAI